MFLIKMTGITGAEFEKLYGSVLAELNVSKSTIEEPLSGLAFMHCLEKYFKPSAPKINFDWGESYQWIKKDLLDYRLKRVIDGIMFGLPEPRLIEDLNPKEQEVKVAIDHNNISKIVDGGKRMSFGEGFAEREPTDGKGRYDLITPFGIRRLAIWYELGSKKYADRNWEKGMPFSRYLDAAKRHLDKYVMGMTDEDHLAAAAWNILSIMHHEELGQMEFDDMPHYLSKKEE